MQTLLPLCLLLCLLLTTTPVSTQPCAPGYFGEQSQGCFDIDECAAPRNLARSCWNGVTGSYTARCRALALPDSATFVNDGDSQTCMQTGARTDPFVAILGLGQNPPHSQANVSTVRIWNSVATPDALAGFEVYVSPGGMLPRNAILNPELYRCPLYTGALDTANQPITVDCEGRSGTGLLIRLPGPNRTIALCEVEVYDDSTADAECPRPCACENTPGSFQCAPPDGTNHSCETNTAGPADGPAGLLFSMAALLLLVFTLP